MASQAFRARGAHVIIASPIPLNPYHSDDGEFHMTGERIKSVLKEAHRIQSSDLFHQEFNPFVQWSQLAADLTNSTYIDLHSILTDYYQKLDPNIVKSFYLPSTATIEPDYIHVTQSGATAVAQAFILALSLSPNSALHNFIKSPLDNIVQANCSL